MTIGERLKYIRKDMKMSQEAFGNTIGVSRDVINNLERDRVSTKDPMIRLICKTHNINYFWIMEEKGDPYISVPSIIVDEAVEKYGLDEMDKAIIEEYVMLSPDIRKELKKLMKNVIKKTPD